MNNLRRWTVQFVAISIFFLAAFAAGQESCQKPDTNTMYNEDKQVIRAEEIARSIRDGEDIYINNALIKGVLDLSALPPELVEDESRHVIYVKGKITTTNSYFENNFNIRATTGTNFDVSNPISIVFKQAVNFAGTTFSEGANFAGMTFSRGAKFAGTAFSVNTTISSNANSSADIDFPLIRNENNVANFRNVSLMDADFTGAKFNIAAHFTDAVFSGNTRFSGATFSWSASFQGATFSDVSFSSTSFLEYAGFSRTIFSNANFSGAKFCESAGFSQTTFSSANFSGIDFYQNVRFAEASFAKNSTFSNTMFKNLDFSLSNFQAESQFDSVRITEGSCFFDTRFQDLVSFWNLKANGGKTIFTSSQFDKKVIFDKTEFSDVDFSATGTCSNKLYEDSESLTPPAVFFDQVSFRNSKVVKANFQEVFFTDLNLSGSTFDSLVLTDTLYNKLFYSGSTDKFFNALDSGFNARSSTVKQKYETLNGLRVNFNELGQLEMTNEAHYKKTKLERDYDPNSDSKPSWGTHWDKLGLNYLLDWTSGFLVRPWQAVKASFIVILFFAVVFYLANVVYLIKDDKDAALSIALNRLPWQNILETKSSPDQSEISGYFNVDSDQKRNKATYAWKSLGQKLWNSFWFSFAVFTKFNLGRRRARRLRWLVIIEWLVGLAMLALLTLSIANSVPGLERIVGAILPA